MRRRTLRILMLPAALVVGLMACEFGVRALGLASPPVAVTADERAYAKLAGVFFPAREKVDRRNPDLAHRVSINDLGFRGSQISRLKPPGQQRILLIGDSFTWGDFVDDSLTLPSQLERALERSCQGVRTLNFGVGGTTIDGHRELLERGLQLAPDLVILVFHDNDVHDLRAPTYWSQLGANRAQKSRFPASLAYRVLRNTALGALVRQAIARAQATGHARAHEVAGGDSAAPMTRVSPKDADLHALQSEYLLRLRAFAARVEEAGLPLVVTAYPSHLAFQDPRSTAFSWFEEIVAAETLVYVDALNVLRSSGLERDSLYLFPFDAHATPTGYRLVAAELARRLGQQQSGMLACAPRAPVSEAGERPPDH